ncbi:hypothetical protein BOTBODRAFT_642580 [Botryobasidium botryosum FD-172 SS1]|uniref:UBC core domain-containing protein n=1 Tax=Botryobasidium botryosum (strain FD-172 SS1) TaxID=930990 RepID=A0A067MCY7_BOTB1|nr:hypothetical protein BOTBODRAFT_642580 [Botryobasidium botryosum FD-172 SS1]
MNIYSPTVSIVRDALSGSSQIKKRYAFEPRPFPESSKLLIVTDLLRAKVTYKNVSPPPPLVSLLHLSCHKCRATYCRGCQQVVKCKSNCPGKGKRPACEVLNCCAAAHAIGLFAALGALDKAYIRRRGTSDSRRSLRVRKKATVSLAGLLKQSKTSNSGSGIGYGSDFSTKRTSVDTAAVKKANSEAKAWDSLAKTAFETIALFLPDAYRDDPRPLDLLPHESIRSMLPLSYLPEIIAEFLRNDNITDWTARSPLYNALLNLLKRLADSELSVGLLIEGRTEKKHSDGIDAWMTKSGEIEWERQADGSTGEARSPLAGLVQRPPLYEHFKKLTRQCEAFTAGASHLVDDHGNEEGPAPEEDVVSTLGICMTIISTKEAIERAIGAWQRHGRGDMDDSAASVTSKGKGKSRDTVVSTEAAYIAAWEKLAFAYLELPRVPLYPATVVATSPAIRSYSYTNEVQSTSSSTRIPKQRFHLVKELGVMSTSLPVGIWVRVDEVRNDAIKIMIAGPAGTPYEGGLFEFDCFIPLDYPKKPPLMTLCTTASGQVRFNPNLYANGKVCLSLLGSESTSAPEELWSTKSTLLQVLISIQSMIFNEAPMYNEPGYGHAVQTDPRSIEYNKNVALQNVRWAMVEWMKDDRKHDLWADVIKSHFSIHRKLIREKYVRGIASRDHHANLCFPGYKDGLKLTLASGRIFIRP